MNQLSARRAGKRNYADTAALHASIQRALDTVRVLQRRLGTAGEQPDDYQRVCDLAHFLNNWQTAMAASEELRALDSCAQH